MSQHELYTGCPHEKGFTHRCGEVRVTNNRFPGVSTTHYLPPPESWQGSVGNDQHDALCLDWDEEWGITASSYWFPFIGQTLWPMQTPICIVLNCLACCTGVTMDLKLTKTSPIEWNDKSCEKTHVDIVWTTHTHYMYICSIIYPIMDHMYISFPFIWIIHVMYTLNRSLSTVGLESRSL